MATPTFNSLTVQSFDRYGSVERTITYEAPFDKCDREEDDEIAWEEFEKRDITKVQQAR